MTAAVRRSAIFTSRTSASCPPNLGPRRRGRQPVGGRIAAMARFDPAAPLVHPLPDPDRVELRPGLAYAEAGGRELAMDLYLPAGRPGSPPPAVPLVHREAHPALPPGGR